MQGALAQLLQALQSSDNTLRGQAEDQLNNEWHANRPDVMLMGLAEQMQVGQDDKTRSFAAILFRRQASKTKKGLDNQSRELFLTLNGDARSPSARNS